MDQEFKEEWVAALRSGEYPQTTKALTKLDRSGNVVGHCCLGVACEIAVKKGWLTTTERPDLSGEGKLRGYLGPNDKTMPEVSVLPHVLKNMIGVEDPHGVVGIPARDIYEVTGLGLPTINDSGESFDHIADLIEYFG